MADGAFWNDQEHAREVVGKVKALKVWIEPFDRLWGRAQGALEMDTLLEADPDPEMIAEVEREASAIREETDAFKLKSLLQGRDDWRDA
ncbi:MAG: PCRF domain-containing protein, partial [Gemmatimonadetes bacterium]|nr:PCRF domain-containing protein [Gemmatimonadota bacterium]